MFSSAAICSILGTPPERSLDQPLPDIEDGVALSTLSQDLAAISLQDAEQAVVGRLDRHRQHLLRKYDRDLVMLEVDRRLQDGSVASFGAR